eukprot:scaffold57021_cov42-Prasinocladus_malaysianus.AAC.1
MDKSGPQLNASQTSSIPSPEASCHGRLELWLRPADIESVHTLLGRTGVLISDLGPPQLEMAYQAAAPKPRVAAH